MGKMSDLGGIFEDDDNGHATSDIQEVLDHMTERIREGTVTMPECLEGILNLVCPGRTDNSHDVLREFRTAMAVQGFHEVGKKVEALFLTIFPWGMGFHLGFESEYPVKAISHDGKTAIVKSLCAILVQGDVNAEVTEAGRIRITSPEGDEQSIGIDDVVKEFRKELDQELGPSKMEQPDKGPDDDAIADWMKRWM